MSAHLVKVKTVTGNEIYLNTDRIISFQVDKPGESKSATYLLCVGGHSLLIDEPADQLAKRIMRGGTAPQPIPQSKAYGKSVTSITADELARFDEVNDDMVCLKCGHHKQAHTHGACLGKGCRCKEFRGPKSPRSQAEPTPVTNGRCTCGHNHADHFGGSFCMVNNCACRAFNRVKSENCAMCGHPRELHAEDIGICVKSECACTAFKDPKVRNPNAPV